MANVFAQAEALAFGKTAERGARPRGRPTRWCPHRTFPGNRPSRRILADRLTPALLGRAGRALRAQPCSRRASIWDIDSFDQWGVELGKVLAQRIVPELEAPGEPKLEHDRSTATLIRRYRARRGR